jgi:hypothetical protein
VIGITANREAWGASQIMKIAQGLMKNGTIFGTRFSTIGQVIKLQES